MHFVSAAKKRKSFRQVLQGKMRNSSEQKHTVLLGAVKQRYLGPRMAGYIHELICIELPLQHQDSTISSQQNICSFWHRRYSSLGRHLKSSALPESAQGVRRLPEEGRASRGSPLLMTPWLKTCRPCHKKSVKLDLKGCFDHKAAAQAKPWEWAPNLTMAHN